MKEPISRNLIVRPHESYLWNPSDLQLGRRTLKILSVSDAYEKDLIYFYENRKIYPNHPFCFYPLNPNQQHE